MDRYEIEKLRGIPILDVAERLGLDVKARKCLCIVHDDHTPSMTFDMRKNTYRCWACGAHGDTLDLVMKVLNLPFRQACEWLANEHNVMLSTGTPPVSRAGFSEACTPAPAFDPARYARYFDHPRLSPQAQSFLLTERRLHPAVLRFCRLNSYRDRNGADWLQIPYYSPEGRLLGIQRRYMGTDPTQPRFRFQRGEHCHLYNQQVIPMLRPDEPLYLAEGPSDTWALLSSGRKAVGIPSATLLRTSDLEFLRDTQRTVHIYPDTDQAGWTLYQKLLTAANDLHFTLLRHDLPEGCKDFAEYWQKGA